jgi:hypothetical protein
LVLIILKFKWKFEIQDGNQYFKFNNHLLNSLLTSDLLSHLSPIRDE